MEKAEEQKMVWAPQVRHNKASCVAKSSCTWARDIQKQLNESCYICYIKNPLESSD